MERALDSDSALRVRAMEQASQIVNDIVTAFKDPSKPIVGESLRVYQELKDWGWLDDYPIQQSANQTMFRKMVAMEKYRSLKWMRDHPKEKKSKWEYVMGKAANKR